MQVHTAVGKPLQFVGQVDEEIDLARSRPERTCGGGPENEQPLGHCGGAPACPDASAGATLGVIFLRYRHGSGLYGKFVTVTAKKIRVREI